MEDLRMSQARSDNRSTPDILGHLETYEKTIEQCQRYASLKDNVEKERQSVQLHIYERVKAEYDRKMTAVEQDLKKQRERLEEKIRELLDRRSELDGLCRKDAERLEEIDFRARVGEFTVEECKEERSELERRAQNQSRELAQLEEIVGRCTKSGLLAEQESHLAHEQTIGLEEAREQPLPKPQDDRAEEASHQPVEGVAPAGEREAPETEAAEEVTEDFEIVEEDPPDDEKQAPVVHCPPSVSSGSQRAGRDSGAVPDRDGPLEAVSEYVTGYLIALEGSRQGERFPMISSNITLGSSPGIDIRLSDAGIANFHARILYKERKHFLENLDGMGRSYVNGVQASAVVELRDGDVIRLGDIKMQVEYASAQKKLVS
jgi:hypothetical protein